MMPNDYPQSGSQLWHRIKYNRGYQKAMSATNPETLPTKMKKTVTPSTTNRSLCSFISLSALEAQSLNK
jgi:hypothetical protein